jgi:hypothetical protein
MIAQLNRALLAFTLALGLAACDGAAPTESNREVAAPASLSALGQTGGKDGVELTITDVATPTQVGPRSVSQRAAPGETFVVVSFTMKNVGSRPLTYMDRPGLTLLDAKGNSYVLDDIASSTVGSMMEDIGGMTSDLNPNVSAKAKMVWKVDKAAFDASTWKVRLDTPSQPLFALK